jgi:hypothetical protein
MPPAAGRFHANVTPTFAKNTGFRRLSDSCPCCMAGLRSINAPDAFRTKWRVVRFGSPVILRANLREEKEMRIVKSNLFR